MSPVISIATLITISSLNSTVVPVHGDPTLKTSCISHELNAPSANHVAKFTGAIIKLSSHDSPLNVSCIHDQIYVCISWSSEARIRSA
jgi:hypothetical protein